MRRQFNVVEGVARGGVAVDVFCREGLGCIPRPDLAAIDIEMEMCVPGLRQFRVATVCMRGWMRCLDSLQMILDAVGMPGAFRHYPGITRFKTDGLPFYLQLC